MQTEIVLMWTAVTLYAAGAVLFVLGLVFRKDALVTTAVWVSLAGLVPHGFAIGIRWDRVDHGPYLGFYEVVSSFAFLSVLLLGILSLRYRSLRAAGIFIMPLAFLLLGAAMFTPKADLEISGTLASWWLILHVSFAKLTFSCFIVSFALAVLYLVRDREVTRSERWAAFFARLPGQETIDDLSFKFVAAGFIFLAIMIVAGAIWANEAWGRYWAWDPIETWSLVAWLIYAIALHLRLTRGWRGRRWAWAAVASLPGVLFALLGVPIVYQSIHGAYLKGY